MIALKAALSAVGLWATAHAPELCMVGGTVAFFGAIGTTAYESIKTKDEVEDFSEKQELFEKLAASARGEVKDIQFRNMIIQDLDLFNEVTRKMNEMGETSFEFIGQEKPLTEQDCEDMAKKFVMMKRLTFAKRLSLPLGLSFTTLLLFFLGFSKMKAMYTGAVLALEAIQMTFEKYRGRVREDQGEAKDLEYLYGAPVEEVQIIDPETGEMTKEFKVNLDGKRDEDLPWGAFYFDERSDLWDEYEGFNTYILRQTQNELQSKLMRVGYLTLNNIREYFGRYDIVDPAGNEVGYVCDGTHEIVDLGIFDPVNEMAVFADQGKEPDDFNRIVPKKRPFVINPAGMTATRPFLDKGLAELASIKQEKMMLERQHRYEMTQDHYKNCVAM